ncbi:MAG: hypothetical protein NZ954_02245 [Thermofilaceae archaeon]|nr:hypothetical protein [Thermofilaceae archaeon]MDW8003494.1 hypothetical protein [Thermofilaceae archaeon]
MSWRKMYLPTLAVLAVVAGSLALACFDPADVYAVEVLLNKPGVTYYLSKLKGVSKIEYMGGTGYAYRSRLDNRLVVVLSEQELANNETYLALRIQAPVVEREYVSFTCPITLPCYPRLRENVQLVLSPGSGEITIPLGTTTFDSSCQVRFKPELSASVRENASLIISGSLLLRKVEKGAEYRVSMPCLLSIGEGCFRIMMLIPGYDAPMRVEAGVYETILTISWSSSAYAEVVLKRLNVECGCIPLMPLDKETGWKSEEGELVKNVGGAVVRVRSSDGVCEVAVEGVESLSDEVTNELEKLFEILGLGRETFRKCSMVKSVASKLMPLQGITEEDVKEALKAELVWLVENNVISGLTPVDITLIVYASKLGYAGWNQKLVWYEGDWVPYSYVPGATLVKCMGSLHPVFSAESTEYAGLSQATVAASGESGEQKVISSATGQEAVNGSVRLQPLAVAVVAAVVAALIAYVVVKRKLFI